MKMKRIRRSPRAIPFRKIIPNMITSGNILSGILSMILTLQGHYAVYLWGWLGIVGALSAAFFGLCGALRLARFNVFHAPGPFQGLPIPAGGLFLASLVMGGISVPPALAAVLAVATGLLMVSSIPYGNLKRLRSGNVNRLKLAFLFALTVALIVTLQGKAPLSALCIYIFSGFFRFDWRKWLALDTAELEEELESEA